MASDRDNIVLTGFMGTGKTTVGRVLASRLGRRFVDTDRIIEQRHGPIPSIFAQEGEAAFRRIERALADELGAQSDLVIATGGGMLVDPDTAHALGGRVYCLAAPVTEILQRVGEETSTVRPLLEGPDPARRVAELLEARRETYSRYTQIQTTGLTPSKVADVIIDQLQNPAMRTIGLLGGMSWESSIEYYRIINEEVRRRLGGSHSAKSVMYSVDFHVVEALQQRGDWGVATDLMIDAARKVEAGGAEVLLICTNTMHRMASEVENAISIPMLHIADATAAAIHQAGLERVALLGTRYTMEADFYRGRLQSQHHLDVRVPADGDRELVHRVIYDELVKGVISDASRDRFLGIIEGLVAGGAEGVIAGCTEIELLVHPEHVSVPYFPTTRLHAEAAVDWALADG